MSKARCTIRADWRLQVGKPAERLSAHYRLDCDFGTAVMQCWETGGSEPVYLCEGHAKEQKAPREARPEARTVKVIATPDAVASKVVDEPTNGHPPATNAAPADAAKEPPNPKPLGPASPTPSIKETPERKPQSPVRVPAPAAQATLNAKSKSAAPAATPAPLPDTTGTKPKSAAPAEVSVPALETKAARPAKDSYLRFTARDLTFGNPAKAMVDEAIWNLATGDYEAYRTAVQQGKRVLEAAEAAGGQVAVVHRKITEYSAKLETALSASGKTVNARDTIDKPLEQAMLEIIDNAAMGDGEKDAAVQQLGALQEWLKQGRQTELTPLEANRIVLAIGDRLNWGGTTEVSEGLKPAYRAIYTSLKSAVQNAVPDVQELHERLMNLHAAKSDLLDLPALEPLPK